VRLRLDATRLPASILDDLKTVLERHPGESEVILVMRTSSGERRLRFGDGFRVKIGAGLNAELDDLLGDAALSAA
jgi:DNA polymerase-3 subunit alpha